MSWVLTEFRESLFEDIQDRLRVVQFLWREEVDKREDHGHVPERRMQKDDH